MGRLQLRTVYETVEWDTRRVCPLPASRGHKTLRDRKLQFRDTQLRISNIGHASKFSQHGFSSLNFVFYTKFSR